MLEHPAINLLTGETINGTVELPAYGVVIGKYL